MSLIDELHKLMKEKKYTFAYTAKAMNIFFITPPNIYSSKIVISVKFVNFFNCAVNENKSI